MCLNPRYIIHPSLKSCYRDYDTFVINGYSRPLISFSNLRITDSILAYLSSDVNAVDNCYVCSSETGEVFPAYLAAPCGHCEECAVSKYSELSARLVLESICYPRQCRPIFFTLTYSDLNLPPDGVSKSDVTQFLNRLHLYMERRGLPRFFRHFVVSEYGSKRGRAHYHGILFGIDLTPFGNIEKFNDAFRAAWSKGFVDWQFARGNSSVCKYASKYVMKSLCLDRKSVTNWSTAPMSIPRPGQNDTFWLGSRVDGGLGSPALKIDSIVDQILRSSDCTIKLLSDSSCGLTSIRVPKFLIDKLFPCQSKILTSKIVRLACYFASVTRLLLSNTVSPGVRSKIDENPESLFAVNQVLDNFRLLRYHSDYGRFFDSRCNILLTRDGRECIKEPVFDDEFFDNYFLLLNYLLSLGDISSLCVKKRLKRRAFLSKYPRHERQSIDDRKGKSINFVKSFNPQLDNIIEL